MIHSRSLRVLTVCIGLALVASACTKNSNSTTSPACTFSVAQPATTFGPEGGSGSAAVTAGSGCAWTATSSAAFAAITAGASGTGNGTVTFTVAVNAATADRTATLTIAGSAITITQRAATSTTPPPTLSAPSAKSPIGGASVDPGRPTLIVNNATSTGAIGTVTYHFEVSDLSSFPNEPVRTFTVDGVAQGSGTTSWTLNRDLGANVLWYWRARATNGTVTGAFSDVETFRTGTPCSFALSTTSVNASAAGGSSSIDVTSTAGCTWTAVSNSPFITVTSGANGTGSGSVTISVSTNTGAARSGTITIAGQTLTVNQAVSVPLSVSFQLFDPGTQAGATTECRFKSLDSSNTTCTLRSTSFALTTNTIVSYAWSVQYTYDTTKTLTGTASTLDIVDKCGGLTATTDGATQPLSVTLTITDNNGATATATSGSGSQPALFVRLFNCGS